MSKLKEIGRRMKNLLSSHVEENSGESMVITTGLRFSQEDRIRQIIRQEMFRRAISDEAESFEDADDFDFDDGEEWVSPYEEVFDPSPETPSDPPEPDPKPAAGGSNPPVTSGGGDNGTPPQS